MAMAGDPALDAPYLLLTPGPLTTSRTVKEAMLRDWSTWDSDYNTVVQGVRRTLVELATRRPGYTSVLIQGSGTFAVEAMVGTAVPDGGTLLVLAGGAYGRRIAQIAERLRIETVTLESDERTPPDLDQLDAVLSERTDISHVAVVHCETTTGLLNPVDEVAAVVRRHARVLLLDAMSSLGGIPMDVGELGAEFTVSSANKCIQGVPGFGYVIARAEGLEACRGRARSLSLDLYDQWMTMEQHAGKWRYTSPTHVVLAFAQALAELEREGGVEARHRRYTENQRALVAGMEELGFRCFLPRELHSPIITTFHPPDMEGYSFERFYAELKAEGFVIYPGKLTEEETFRIANIGHVFQQDIDALLAAVRTVLSRIR